MSVASCTRQQLDVISHSCGQKTVLVMISRKIILGHGVSVKLRTVPQGESQPGDTVADRAGCRGVSIHRRQKSMTSERSLGRPADPNSVSPRQQQDEELIDPPRGLAGAGVSTTMAAVSVG